MKQIDVRALAASIQQPWRPAPVCSFDGYHAFVVVIEGSFYPHRHDRDEFYYVLEGTVQVEVGGQQLSLQAGEALLIEADEAHHTSATSRAVLLVVESRSLSYEPTAGLPDDELYQGGPI